MGCGMYRSSDWSKLRGSSKISETSTASQIFRANKCEEKFNPKFIEMREARDNEDHPNSTPVIIGLDVTGSMGYLSAEIAKNGLNETMMKIYSTKPIDNPQLMFAAIGDVEDEAPLQVTQFESDIRIAEQLLGLWLEGRGGDMPEDFELLWYFANKHTSTDAFEKHGKKGYIFTIGDADVHEYLAPSAIERIFGDKIDSIKNIPSKKLAKEVAEKYEVFHIHLSRDGRYVPKNFIDCIPGRILYVLDKNVNALPEVIISTLQLCNGMDRKDIIKQWPELSQPIVEEAISKINLNEKRKGIFF